MRPIISVENVRDALYSLLYTTHTLSASPLEQLNVVTKFVRDHKMPPSKRQRHFVLRRLLVDFITEQLTRHRVQFGRPAPNPMHGYAEAVSDLNADAATGRTELVCWSLLYHRYVRVDLDLSVKEMAEHCNYAPRTFQRYHRHGIVRLTEHLLARELDATA